MKPRCHSIFYSPRELAWIEAHKLLPRRAAHAKFCARFDRADVSLIHFKSLCKRKGWLTGRTGCYPKGNIPENKGKKQPFNAASARTQFKTGQKPANAKPLGHERVNAYGYVEIKVAERNPCTGAASRYVNKHRQLWEAENGPVPDGHRLKCLDGNKQNTDPSNWDALPYALAPRLNGRFGRDYDTAPPEIKPTIMAIAKLEHLARETKK